MVNSNKIPGRRPTRLADYDYSSNGMYFVTMCTRGRRCLFGNVIEGEMRLNEFGLMVKDCWMDLPNHYHTIHLDYYSIMPNHFHGIVGIIGEKNVGAGLKPAPTKNNQKHHALPEVVRGFKTYSARRINECRNTIGIHVWQRSFYDHIIRDESDLYQIRKYIMQNPRKWHLDEENPANL